MKRPLLVLVGAVVLLASLLAWNTARDASACRTKAAAIGTDYRYSYLTGCELRFGTRWVNSRVLYVTPSGVVLEQVHSNLVPA